MRAEAARRAAAEATADGAGRDRSPGAGTRRTRSRLVFRDPAAVTIDDGQPDPLHARRREAMAQHPALALAELARLLASQLLPAVAAAPALRGPRVELDHLGGRRRARRHLEPYLGSGLGRRGGRGEQHDRDDRDERAHGRARVPGAAQQRCAGWASGGCEVVVPVVAAGLGGGFVEFGPEAVSGRLRGSSRGEFWLPRAMRLFLTRIGPPTLPAAVFGSAVHDVAAAGQQVVLDGDLADAAEVVEERDRGGLAEWVEDRVVVEDRRVAFAAVEVGLDVIAREHQLGEQVGVGDRAGSFPGAGEARGCRGCRR